MTTDLINLFDCDETRLRAMLAEALSGADDGELFIEHAQAEALTFDNGRLKGGSFNTDQGFGPSRSRWRIRRLCACGRTFCLRPFACCRCGKSSHARYAGSYAAAPQRTNKKLTAMKTRSARPPSKRR